MRLGASKDSLGDRERASRDPRHLTSASGKTYVADLLQAHLSLPLIAKDDIKEVLFDTLGAWDAAWSRSLGRAAFALLYANARTTAAGRAGRDRRGRHRRDPRPVRFAELRLASFAPFEIHCTASSQVLRERYAIRVDTRHPGHADAERLAHPETEISEAAYPALRLGGPVEILDTTRFATVEIDPCSQPAQSTSFDTRLTFRARQVRRR